VAGAAGSVGGVLAYGYVYNLLGATLSTGDPVPFDSVGPLLGILFTPGSTNITVVNAGTYLIDFSASGVEPNQFAILINNTGTASSGIVYGSGAGTQQNNGSMILVLPAGAVITLNNFMSSASPIFLQTMGSAGAPAGGTQSNIGASVTIVRLV
jgi:hypothetical protein